MTLAPGSRIGPYEVVAPAGAGGMGEVYRATDSVLKRTVALKVLPARVASDPDRLSRFKREAETLAALGHPNIAGIYGLEASDGVHALVMEFVEGPTLADRIARGPIPPGEAMPIAVQIAEALEFAHESGIVHRDLKPANLKLRSDGTVKVLDFGLAKSALSGGRATESIPVGAGPTMASPAVTTEGTILGTVSYMAPEQARGLPVDRRADIWAYGCVLYEMLTGRPAFPGESSADVIAAIVTREPDLTALPESTPFAMREVLGRCLVKDPRQRLRDLGDARLLLQRPSPAAQTAKPTIPGVPPRAAIGVLAASLAVVTTAFLLTTLRRPAVGGGIAGSRLAITFPGGSDLQKGQPLPSLAVSPDGQTIVYTATGPEGNQLWVRHLDRFAPAPIAGTAGGRLAFFSPDGRWIGFVAASVLKKMPVTLGTAEEICLIEGTPRGATWTDAGEIIFATCCRPGAGLWRVSENGGTPVRVVEGEFDFPDALPGGKAVLATANNPAADETSSDLTIVAVSLAAGTVKELFHGGTYARYLPSGHIAYLRGGAILAAPFDAADLTVGDSRVSMIPDAFMDPSISSGNFAVSATGMLAYVPGDPADFQRSLIAIDPSRRAEPARALIETRQAYSGARISPDGRFLAVSVQAWRPHIGVVELARQTHSQLTSTRFRSMSNPVWAPDSRTIAFRGVTDDGASGIYRASAEGTGPADLLYPGPEVLTPESWARDGASLVVTESRANRDLDMKLLVLGETPEVRPLLVTEFMERDGAVSPDGRWIAYTSSRSGRLEVYVSAFPAMQPSVRVSIEGGQMPVWAPDGRRLYFRRDPSRVMAAEFTSAGVPLTSTPVEVATIPRVMPMGFVEPLPDGRILALDGHNISATPELRLVLNWLDEVRDRVH